MMDRHPLRFEGLTAARVNPGAYKMTITVQIYGPAALKASLPPPTAPGDQPGSWFSDSRWVAGC